MTRRPFLACSAFDTLQSLSNTLDCSARGAAHTNRTPSAGIAPRSQYDETSTRPTSSSGLYVCFLGLALVIASSTSLSLFTGASVQEPPTILGTLVTNVTRIAVFLAAAFASRSLSPLIEKPAVQWTAGAVASVGMAVFLASSLIDGAPLAVNLLGNALSAAGYAALYLMWTWVYAKMDLPHALLYFTLVHLCSAGVSYVLAIVPSTWFVVAVLVVMPVASSALLAASSKRGLDAPFMQGETPVSGWSFPLKPVILLATFTFANNFARSMLTNEMRGVALVGVMAAACMALLLAAPIRKRGLRPLYALSMPLVIAGTLCVLITAPAFGTIGAVLTNAAYTLFSIYTTVLLCSISYRYGVNALWLFGFAQAAITFGSLSSKLLSGSVDFVSGDALLPTLAVSVIVLTFVCLYVLFDTAGERADSWGILRPNSGEETFGEVDLQEACARVARQYGLTRREEEVALLLAQGVSFADVEQQLCVSNSTLKTHARHIYAKMGVPGRSELADVVQREARSL